MRCPSRFSSLLFILYTTPLSTLISSLSLNHHLYADDTQLFFSFYPSVFDYSITRLQHSLQQISSWMTANLLTLNSSKTEFLLIGLPYNNWTKLIPAHWLLLTLLATVVLSLMNTYFLCMTRYLLSLNHICELRCIRPYLDCRTASTIATSIVHSKLDYCNSLYYNLPQSQIKRLQKFHSRCTSMPWLWHWTLLMV